MTDYFALLDEPRRPWIDPDRLKRKFLSLSARVHPDRVHTAPEAERLTAGASYSELNAAYNCLREPKDRLRHLLELESGAKPADVERIPAGTMDAFFEVAQLCRAADALLAEQAAVSSPLLKLRFFERTQELSAQLGALQGRINHHRDELLAELKTMNPAWEAEPSAMATGASDTFSPTGGEGRDEGEALSGQKCVESSELPLERLEHIYRLLGYFARWSEQLQERTFQLSI
jgi:curved DNA-binding protein CbpA